METSEARLNEVDRQANYKLIELEEKRVTVVRNPWPILTQISLKLLSEPSMCRVTDSGKIEVRVHNGWAIYRLTKEQFGDSYLCLELEDSGT